MMHACDAGEECDAKFKHAGTSTLAAAALLAVLLGEERKALRAFLKALREEKAEDVRLLAKVDAAESLWLRNGGAFDAAAMARLLDSLTKETRDKEASRFARALRAILPAGDVAALAADVGGGKSRSKALLQQAASAEAQEESPCDGGQAKQTRKSDGMRRSSSAGRRAERDDDAEV